MLSPSQRRFAEMMLALARSVRRGRDVELARAAADWELAIQSRLNEGENVIPMAASFAARDADPQQTGGNGGGR